MILDKERKESIELLNIVWYDWWLCFHTKSSSTEPL